MNNTIYPLGLIATQQITPWSSVVADAFESGATATRNLWAANSFKRYIQLEHDNLTLAEWRWLRSFYQQRSGGLDAFWFRDNIGRTGNINARFTQPPAPGNGTIGSNIFTETHNGVTHSLQLMLEEIAPIRALPEFDELTAAAGNTPFLWYDANREFYLQHCGQIILDASGATWDTMLNYPAPWQGGSSLNLGNLAAQYQFYHSSGVEWSRTTANIAQLTGAQPACTIFLIHRASTTAAKQVLFSIGAKASGSALGIALAADNHYEPWLGGSETWSAARQNNSAADTWRSLALVWSAAANTVTLYTNAAGIGTDTNTRSLSAGPAALGAAPDGTLITNPSNALINCDAAHILAFPAALTATQIKSIHNLLGYQYGLATV